ncbi:MAG: hypothetical protein SOI13_04235 [Bifidobacterium mongoliense]|jgi:hypothetical protein|uniref:hypothetical protein n=1 Tax=Bifidobacterium mongoliense TaxID=518643 RepID=UPI002F35CB81
MGASKSKYTDSELAELAALPEFELSPGEKRAVTRWKKRMVRENTPVVRKPVEVAVNEFKEVAPEDVSREPERALETAKELTWYGETWPDDAELPLAEHGGKYVREARALKEFAGRVARIERGLTRSQAIKVRLRVVKGEFVAFKPRGAYDARLLKEYGLYSVLVKYVGGAK